MQCIKLLDDIFAKKIFSDKVYDPPDGYENFIIEKKIYKDHIIDLRTIIGSTMRSKHEDIWLNTLSKLKRRKSNFDKYSCDEIIKFYIDPNYMRSARSHGWHIVFINKYGFISQGHHRTTIAKFLSTIGLIPHNITIPQVTYYNVDMKNFRNFKRLNKKLSLLKKIVGNNFHCRISVKNDNYKISYFLSINMQENDDLIEPLYEKKFSSFKDLKVSLFQYLREYCQKRKSNEQISYRVKKFLFGTVFTIFAIVKLAILWIKNLLYR